MRNFNNRNGLWQVTAIVFVFALMIKVLVIVGVVSLVVSSVKRVTNSCSETWPLDRYTWSHMFCPQTGG